MNHLARGNETMALTRRGYTLMYTLLGVSLTVFFFTWALFFLNSLRVATRWQAAQMQNLSHLMRIGDQLCQDIRQSSQLYFRHQGEGFLLVLPRTQGEEPDHVLYTLISKHGEHGAVKPDSFQYSEGQTGRESTGLLARQDLEYLERAFLPAAGSGQTVQKTRWPMQALRLEAPASTTEYRCMTITLARRQRLAGREIQEQATRIALSRNPPRE